MSSPINSVVPFIPQSNQLQPVEIVASNRQISEMHLPNRQIVNVVNKLELNSTDSLIYIIFSSISKVIMGAVCLIIAIAAVLIDHKNPLSDEVIKDSLEAVKDIGKTII